MTQEEKAKAYDEALKRAKEMYDAYRFSVDLSNFKPTDFEYIFPQLSETEDERIRKSLVALIKEIKLQPLKRLEDWDGMLAWLEKQKERGPLTKEEEYTLHRIIEYLEDETCPSEWISLLHDIYCLPYEKQKEQKPAEWSEEDEKEVADYIFKTCDGFTEYSAREVAKDILSILRPQPHWKPSDEQMAGLAHAINLDVYDAKRYHLESLYNDLNKLKDESTR